MMPAGSRWPESRLPIELKIYDDQSNLDTSMRLLTKLIEEGQGRFRHGARAAPHSCSRQPAVCNAKK